jgi:hypothetical protein
VSTDPDAKGSVPGATVGGVPGTDLTNRPVKVLHILGSEGISMVIGVGTVVLILVIVLVVLFLRRA